MANLIQWIEYCADADPVIGVVIGAADGYYAAEKIPNYKDQPRGKVIS